MSITECTELAELIKRFNKEREAVNRYALAEAIKAELNRYLFTLDDTILPMFRAAAVRQITGIK